MTRIGYFLNVGMIHRQTHQENRPGMPLSLKQGRFTTEGLNWAVEMGEVRLIKLIMKHHSESLNVEEAISKAIRNENGAALTTILNNTSLPKNFRYLEFALIQAIGSGKVSLMKTLVKEYNADNRLPFLYMKEENQFVSTRELIVGAVERRDVDLVAYLLSGETSFPQLNSKIKESLGIAVENGGDKNFKIVQLILNSRSRVLNEAFMLELLETASDHGNDEIFELLLSHPNTPVSSIYLLGLKYLKKGHHQDLERLLKKTPVSLLGEVALISLKEKTGMIADRIFDRHEMKEVIGAAANGKKFDTVKDLLANFPHMIP